MICIETDARKLNSISSYNVMVENIT